MRGATGDAGAVRRKRSAWARASSGRPARHSENTRAAARSWARLPRGKRRSCSSSSSRALSARPLLSSRCARTSRSVSDCKLSGGSGEGSTEGSGSALEEVGAGTGGSGTLRGTGGDTLAEVTTRAEAEGRSGLRSLSNTGPATAVPRAMPTSAGAMTCAVRAPSPVATAGVAAKAVCVAAAEPSAVAAPEPSDVTPACAAACAVADSASAAPLAASAARTSCRSRSPGPSETRASSTSARASLLSCFTARSLSRRGGPPAQRRIRGARLAGASRRC